MLFGSKSDVIWAVMKTRSEAVAEARMEPGGPPSRPAGEHGNRPKSKKNLGKTSIWEPKRMPFGASSCGPEPQLEPPIFFCRTIFFLPAKKRSHFGAEVILHDVETNACHAFWTVR